MNSEGNESSEGRDGNTDDKLLVSWLYDTNFYKNYYANDYNHQECPIFRTANDYQCV